MQTPTLKEELDRKSVETIQWLMLSKEDKSITAKQYALCLDVVNMITLGLIDKDVSEAVTLEAHTTRRQLEKQNG